MTSETSREALARVAARLPKKRRAVFEVLAGWPKGGTASEVKAALALANRHDPNAEKRCAELANSGHIIECATRRCRQTGMRAIVWLVAHGEPKPRPKRATRAELLGLLRNLYGDLTTQATGHEDGGAVILDHAELELVVSKTKLAPHLKAISAAMDAEDEGGHPF